MGPARSVLRPERVGKVGQPPRRHSHNVESHFDVRPFVGFEEFPRGLHDSLLLRPIDRIFGMGLGASPHLHFDKHHRRSVQGDEVDLPVPGLKPPRDYGVPEGFEVGGGPVFGLAAYASKVRQACSSFRKGRNDIR